MSHYTNLGPGDSATWPPCTQHPLDPRRRDEPDYLDMSDEERVEWWLATERPRAIARELVDIQRRPEWCEVVMRRHGLPVPR